MKNTEKFYNVNIPLGPNSNVKQYFLNTINNSCNFNWTLYGIYTNHWYWLSYSKLLHNGGISKLNIFGVQLSKDNYVSLIPDFYINDLSFL